MLQLALKYFHVSNPDFWVQPVSFAFVLTLGVTSVRGFILNLIKVCATCFAVGLCRVLACIHMWSQMFAFWSSADTSNSVVMFLAEVMGAYFISVVLLIRMAMPVQYRSGPVGRSYVNSGQHCCCVCVCVAALPSQTQLEQLNSISSIAGQILFL